MTVTLFIPCFVDLFYPQVGMAMVRILERLGHRVVCPETPACCGQPAFNTGYWRESRAVAVRVLEQFASAEVVIVASGSCGAMVKMFYPEMFAGTPQEGLARQVSAKCFEFAQFLVDGLGVADLGARFPHKVTYHDGCHSLRELGIQEAPRRLLQHVRDVQFVEMKQTVCCGFGGTFSAKFPSISTAMGEVKCDLAGETGAEYLVSSDSSCLMHLQGLIDRRQGRLKTIHLAEVLAGSPGN
jgi:L-lactate dehydrogenase complex protein LldE